MRIELSKKEPQTSSFRRNAQTLKPIQPIHSDCYPISKNVEKRLTLFLRIALLYKSGLFPPQRVLWLSEYIVSRIHQFDTHLGKKGENPSILFTIFHHEPSRRKEIVTLLSFLEVSRPSIHRDAVTLAFSLNLARYSVRFPLTFQKCLQIVLQRMHPRRDNVVEYFRRRKFKAQQIRYSSAELVEWLSKVVVSTRSMRPHLPLVARIIRKWNIGPIPLQVVNSLIWMYIPRNLQITALAHKYGVQSTNVHSALSYNTLISMVTHTIRRCNPAEVDILLIQTLIQHLIESDRFLFTISIFDTLQEIKMESTLNSDILLKLFEKLIATQNHEEAIHVYSALLRSRLQKGNGRQERTPEQIHVEFVQQHPNLIVKLLHGLRKSTQSQEYVIELLKLLPEQTITNHPELAAEALRYAGYWSNQGLVRTILNAIHHPLYDESFDPHGQPCTFGFSAEMWSAILFAHVQLGLVNSSRLILKSMQLHGFQPRSEDVSAIVIGVAKYNLEGGYDLAIKLSESLTIDAYETILEYALKQGHEGITEWAKNLVVYERRLDSWEMPADDNLLYPESYKMNSVLSTAMENASVRTCTPRAKGAIIRQVATTEGIGPAILLLLGSQLKFSRDVYDGLYDVAFDGGHLQYAMWLANEMRERGWMPRDYRALKKQVRHYNATGQWRWL